MFFLALRNLRARTGRTLFTAFAISLGIALVFATRMVGVAADEHARAPCSHPMGISNCRPVHVHF